MLYLLQMSKEVNELAKVIWDYHHMNHELAKADCIVVLGSHDIRVAERGTQLLLDGWAPLVLFSGGLGNLMKGVGNETEADKFAKVARAMGVPSEKILIENRSTNTGENVTFSRKLLEERGIVSRVVIAVQKPYMERRTYATFRKQWPEVNVAMTSPQISFEKYPTEEISKDDVISLMVGDLKRIKEYSAKGFQIPQEIPDEVWNAYLKLVELGYTKHLTM